MKFMNFAIFRCLCAFVVGILLITYPDQISIYLIILIGALFFVPGLFTVISYYTNGKRAGLPYPVSGIGSALFGLWLMVMPGFFANILMYALGAALVLGGIHQISRLIAIKEYTTVSVVYYVFPILVVIAGFLVLMNPFAARQVPIILLGISTIIYAVFDFVRILRFRKYIEQVQPEVIDVDAEEVNNDIIKSE